MGVGRKVCNKYRIHEEIAPKLRTSGLWPVRDERTKVKGSV